MNRKRPMNPVYLLLALMLVLNFLRQPSLSLTDWLYDILTFLPGIILALGFHEAAHAYVSHWLGDPLPRAQGRLTLNPIAHMDPFGFLFILMCGFGWGRPVSIDPRYYRKPRRDEALTALAGVTMNFLLAIVFTLVLKAILAFAPGFLFTEVGDILRQIILKIIQVNLGLMLFNLLPCAPLDGFNLVTQIFNLRRYSWYPAAYQWGMPVLMLLIIFNVVDRILLPPLTLLYGFLDWILML